MENKNWTVYVHTCPNSKRYVGITSQSVEKRWAKGNGYWGHRYFFNAIQKYGWENIKHEILFENLTESEAKQKEIELIAFYNSYDREFGYNQTLGGDGRKGAMSEKQKELLSVVNRGKNAVFSKEEIVSLKKDLLNGFSYDEISNKYGIKKENISVIVSGKNYGYIMPEFVDSYKKIKQKEKEDFNKKIIDLVLSGKSGIETAKILNISKYKVYDVLKKYKLKTKKSNIIKSNKKIKNEVLSQYLLGVNKKTLIKKYNLTTKQFNYLTKGAYTKIKLKEDEKLKQQMCELRKQGWQVKDIAKKYGCHREKVSKLTKDFAIELKMIDVRKVYELKDKGFTNREIARTVKRDIDFVENWLNKKGQTIC